MGEKSISTIQIDNDRAQVSESRFPPGAETGFHRHEYDYVVVPLTTGRLKLIGPDGAVTYSELRAGQSYFRHAGVEHNVVNDNPFDFAFVEIQIK